jgi:predicted nucleic acid-binding protein
LLLRTYIDSGVLIFAARGIAPVSDLALPFVTDPAREYVTSDYVRLEVLPKASFHGREIETEFYEAFFRANILCVSPSAALVESAMDQAVRTGMGGIDALHIVCAVSAGAEEFITSEKLTSPIHRTRLIKVISIFPAPNMPLGPE